MEKYHVLGARYPADFEMWYRSYPIERRKAIDDAARAWEKRRKAKDLPPLEVMIESLRRHVLYDPDWSRDNLRFVPLPATYLNKGKDKDPLGPGFERPDPLKQALAEGR